MDLTPFAATKVFVSLGAANLLFQEIPISGPVASAGRMTLEAALLGALLFMAKLYLKKDSDVEKKNGEIKDLMKNHQDQLSKKDDQILEMTREFTKAQTTSTDAIREFRLALNEARSAPLRK